MASDDARLQAFLDLSVDVTAFSEVELRGTGYAVEYLETTRNVIGDDLLAELLQVYESVVSTAGNNHDACKQLLRAELLSSPKLGPIVRNVIKLWYASTWYELPQTWRDQYGTPVNDGTFVVAPWAYPEALLWAATGTHPPGAKAPGYGTWSAPPRIPEIRVE
jgi:hypothetical protein